MSTSLSTATAPTPLVVIPQRRRRESVEVIDVDLWEDDRPTQRRRISPDVEVIDLVDSDVEEIQQPIASGSNTAPRPDLRRRLLSPPAPDPEVEFIPPVPRIPQTFLNPYPYRERDRPIVPNANPFVFETELARVRAREREYEALRQASVTATTGALPTIRFGGALVTDYHAMEAHRRRERELRRQQSHGFRHRTRPTSTSTSTAVRLGATRILALNFDYGFDDPALYEWGGWWHGEREREAEVVHYKPEYTHPRFPQPGFSFDFAPTPVKAAVVSSKASPIVIDDDDDDNEPKPVEPESTTPVLVCARCDDALVMGVTGDAAEERRRRIWALRCGHMIDGKCADEVSVPSPTVPDGKGKGKAKDETEGEGGGGAVNPIRSRLRSYHPGQAFSMGLERMSSYLKGKAKAEEYIWTCPVPGCGRAHKSVKNDGDWGPDKGEGMIGVFV